MPRSRKTPLKGFPTMILDNDIDLPRYKDLNVFYFFKWALYNVTYNCPISREIMHCP